MPMVNGLSKSTAAAADALTNVHPTEISNNHNSSLSLNSFTSTADGNALASRLNLVNVQNARDGNSTDLDCTDPSASIVALPKSVNASVSGDKLLREPSSTEANQPQHSGDFQLPSVSIAEATEPKQPDGATTKSKNLTRDSDAGAEVKRLPFLCEKLLRDVCDKTISASSSILRRLSRLRSSQTWTRAPFNFQTTERQYPSTTCGSTAFRPSGRRSPASSTSRSSKWNLSLKTGGFRSIGLTRRRSRRRSMTPQTMQPYYRMKIGIH